MSRRRPRRSRLRTDGGGLTSLSRRGALRKAAAFANPEDLEPGRWRLRQSRLPGGVLSYELRPGGNRPGPSALWAGFDPAVELPEVPMESRSVSAQQLALEHLSPVMHEIAGALVDRNI